MNKEISEEKNNIKVLVCGGHLTPALAVIEALPKSAEVLYVGRKYALEGDSAVSLEYQAITKRGISFAILETGRLQRKWTQRTLRSLTKIPSGFWQALQIVRSFKPDVVIGFGGYVSVPLCIAAFMLKIPVVIHEQTLEAGLANKIIAPFAVKICVSWTESLPFFPQSKTVVTGNPALNPIFKAAKQKVKKGNAPTIVIVGGSQGSHSINVIIQSSLEKLLENYDILHQTGDAKEFNDYAQCEKIKMELPDKLQNRYKIVKFIDPKEIGEILNNADLVVTRAGMNTIGTLLVLNKPAIVIPLPNSQNNEQKKNAMFLKKIGLAEIVYQESITEEGFIALVDAMIKSISSYTLRKDSTDMRIHEQSIKKIIEILFYAKTLR